MQTRLEQLMQKLPASIDCAIITSDVNRRYFTGMRSSAGTVLAFRDAAYLIIDFRYIEKARACVKDCQVMEQSNLYQQITALLEQHQAKRMAVEAETMTIQAFASLKQQVGNLVELDCSDVLSDAISHCRRIKSEQELQKMRAAQQLAETALEQVLQWLHPGVTERDIQLKLDFAMLQLGAEDLSFPTIALTGTKTSMPHGVPEESVVVQPGSFVLMDFGAVVDGYHSDMTRTVCVGAPTETMRQVYNVVLKAQKAALQAVHAGITGKELDAVARTILTDAGYGAQFGHALGHSVGLEIHEQPNASPSSQAVFQDGTIITVEPGVYLPGQFGVRIEDFVVVRESSCENLTKAPKELICL